MKSSWCAICADDAPDGVQRPLGKNNALVTVCRSCDEDAPPTVVDNTRGYEPQGGLLSVEAARASKKVVSREKWARDSKDILSVQRGPSPVTPNSLSPDSFYETRQLASARRARVKVKP